MEVEGIVKIVNDSQTFGSGFTKRELVITTEEQYPQHLLIEFVQDKVALLDSLAEGDKVKVGINLRGREWTAPDGVVKYFNSIQGWRIEKATGAGAEASAEMPPPPAFEGSDAAEEGQEDDLPF